MRRRGKYVHHRSYSCILSVQGLQDGRRFFLKGHTDSTMPECLIDLLAKLHGDMGKDQHELHVFVGEKQSQKELDHSLEL